MSKYASALLRLKRDDNGMAALEYSLLLAVGAIATTTVVNLVGDELTATFTLVAAAFSKLG